jgi:hypothetical protein
MKIVWLAVAACAAFVDPMAAVAQPGAPAAHQEIVRAGAQASAVGPGDFFTGIRRARAIPRQNDSSRCDVAGLRESFDLTAGLVREDPAKGQLRHAEPAAKCHASPKQWSRCHLRSMGVVWM